MTNQITRTLDEYSTAELQRELARRREDTLLGICDYCDKPLKSEPVCRFPDRHNNEPIPGTPITEEWLRDLFSKRPQPYWPAIWLSGNLNIVDNELWNMGELVCKIESQEQLLAFLEGINYS